MNKRIFSFALGNIWRWTKSKNIAVLVDYAKQLDISGVEVTFASKEELYFFELSEDNELWLKNLDYVSIHAPFNLVRGSKNEKEVIRQLDIISKLYADINAENLIIHPNELPSPEMLKKYDLDVSTENLPLESYTSVSNLRSTFKEYPDMGLCLDVSHAYLRAQNETSILINAFEDRISQIHLSGTHKNKDHQSLRNVTEEFLSSIQSIKELNVPVVIEEDIEIKDLEYVKKEIEYIKNILG
jgi:endonuclease IV